MRPLFITPENKRIAQGLAEFASREENRFIPGCGWLPGYRPEFVRTIDTYRCVFTLTQFPDAVAIFRHLSISVPEGNCRHVLPNLAAAFTVASWFGFTGGEELESGIVIAPAPDWIVLPGVDDTAEFTLPGVLVLAQQIMEPFDDAPARKQVVRC